jgi:ATP-dependent DNA helicase RecG
MEAPELLEIAARGEDGKHQFKANVTNAQSLSEELVAFSNSGGGRLFIGISDNGTVSGLTGEDIRRLNGLVANASTNNVHHRPFSGFLHLAWFENTCQVEA